MRIHKDNRYLNVSLGANGLCEERIIKSKGIVWMVWTSILLKGVEGISVEGLDFSCLVLTGTEKRESWNIVPHCSIHFQLCDIHALNQNGDGWEIAIVSNRLSNYF